MHYRLTEHGWEPQYSPYEPANEKTHSTHQHMGHRERNDWSREYRPQPTKRRYGDIYGRE